MTSAQFPRTARLTRRVEFLAVQAEGKRFSGRYIVLYYKPDTTGDSLRLGLTVSKKVSTLSTKRNLIRRRLRNIGRLLRIASSAGGDVVLIAKTGALNATFNDLQTDVIKLFTKAALLPSDWSGTNL